MIHRHEDLPEAQIAQSFYDRVFADPVLGPLFPDRSLRHSERLALYLAQVFRGSEAYQRQRGGLPTLVARHRGWNFTDQQRERWVALMMESLSQAGAAPELLDDLRRYFHETAMLAQFESRKLVASSAHE